MRYLITGLAARLGWLPTCDCHEAVAASAEAHAQTWEELRLERADNARLRMMLAVPAPREEAAHTF